MIFTSQEAIFTAAKLPELEQNQIAAKIREEIETINDDARWDNQFADSLDVLEMLYDEGLQDYHAGRTVPVNRLNLISKLQEVVK